jgi:hypothetical protein
VLSPPEFSFHFGDVLRRNRSGPQAYYPVFPAKTLGPEVTIANAIGERKGKGEKTREKMIFFAAGV